jgi:kynurenine formamidase
VSDQTDGNEAHRILFGRDTEHFICGIEDMNLTDINPDKLRRVFALPLLVDGLDSSVITVLAELDG